MLTEAIKTAFNETNFIETINRLLIIYRIQEKTII